MSHAPQALRNGRYCLVEPVGSGGMGSVHRAWDQRLQVWRAIKLLHPQYAAKASIRRRFEAEARTLAAIEHPNVVRVVDVDQEGETPFLVMELLEGGSPADWLQRHGAMPPRLAVDVVAAACDGVAAAHARGIVHRDLKPQNLLLGLDGSVKVADFGIARVREETGEGIEALTRTGAAMGTLGFMAPEQRLDAKAVDARADVYALGATLFTLCTNRVAIELFAADQAPHVLQGLPPRLTPVVVKACRMDPDARYPTVAALAADLRKLRPTFPALDPATPPLVAPGPRRQPPIPSAPAAATMVIPAAAPAAPPAPAHRGLTPGARSWKQWDGQRPPELPPTDVVFAGPSSPTELRPVPPPPRPDPLVGPPDDDVLTPEPPRFLLCVHLECGPKRRLGGGRPFDAVPVMVDGVDAPARERLLHDAALACGAAPERVVIRGRRDGRAWSWRELVDARELVATTADGCLGCAARATEAAYGCLAAVTLPLPESAERWLAGRLQPTATAGGQHGADWLRLSGARGRRMETLRRSGLLSREGPFEAVVATGWLRSTRIDTSTLLEALLLPATPSIEPDSALPPLLLLGLLAVEGTSGADLGREHLAGLGSVPPGADRLAVTAFVGAEEPEAAPLRGLLRALYAGWAHGVRTIVVEGPAGG
jgi:serine/threonine protein kinase